MLKKEEAAAILDNREMAPFPSQQARLFFSFSYYTGFSVKVVGGLTWSAVDEAAGVVEGGGKKRPITKALAPLIEELKKEEKKLTKGELKLEALLFHTPAGDPLDSEWIQHTFESTMDAAGIDFKKRKLIPDSFRRTYNFWFA